MIFFKIVMRISAALMGAILNNRTHNFGCSVSREKPRRAPAFLIVVYAAVKSALGLLAALRK